MNTLQKECIKSRIQVHFVSCALRCYCKTVTLRPRLNCFVAGHRVYERKALSVSFVVKKRFEDNSYEALAIVDIDRQGQPPVDQIHDKVEKFVTSVRKQTRRTARPTQWKR